MQLEAGKYYKTRDGRKVGPMIDMDNGCSDPWKAYLPGEEVAYWRDSGSHWGDIRPSDLIAEWPSETAQTTLTAIDHLRKAAELFLAAGNDKAAFDVLGVVLDHE